MKYAPDGAAAAVARRVYSEYVEMPGLQLSLKQAQRLFGLGESECATVIEALVECRLLMRLPDGRIARTGTQTRMQGRAGRVAMGDLTCTA